MLLPAVILLLSVTLGKSNSKGVYTEDVTPDERVLKILQRIAARPTPELLSDYFTYMSKPWLSARIPSSTWWWHVENPHPETKRRQNLASYNLNSFGLRYGK